MIWYFLLSYMDNSWSTVRHGFYMVFTYLHHKVRTRDVTITIFREKATPGVAVLHADLYPGRICVWKFNAGFFSREENRRTRTEPLGEGENELRSSTHILHRVGIDPGPHWWEASVLTIAPSRTFSQCFLRSSDVNKRDIYMANCSMEKARIIYGPQR